MARGERTAVLVFVAVVGGQWLGACATGSETRDNAKASRAFYRLGADFFAKKRARLAKAQLIKSIELDADNREAQYLLGVLYFFEGVHAGDFVDRLQCLKGEAAKEQRNLANRLLHRAEAHLLKSVKLAEDQKKEESDGLNYLSNVAMHFKRYDDAVGYCERAMANVLYGGQHLALSNRGWALFHKGDLKGAVRDLRQALYHQPKFCLGRYRLAKVYFKQKRTDDALAELKQIAEGDGCPIQDSARLLGLLYLKKGMLDQARAQFDRCVQMSPKSCVSFECRRYKRSLQGADA